MGESETVVALTSSAHLYSSSGFTAPEYPGLASNTSLETSDFSDTLAETPLNYSSPVDPINSITYCHSMDDADHNGGNSTSTVKGPFSDSIQAKQYTDVVDDIVPVVSLDKDVSVTSHSVEQESFANGSVCAAESLILNDSGGIPDINAINSLKENDISDNTVLSTEEDRLWSIVGANSLDFSAWTALIEETEKMAEENILRIRKVYDAFLAEFPLCYGYWKKYADHEARFGSIEKVVEVYERSVNGVTYSVDMWLHYCIFAISTFGDTETIRRLFERGLAYIGTDYLSYTLWDKYIEYEYSHHEWAHLAMIYTRILEHPNQQLDRYFNSFKELAGNRSLSDLQTTEESTSFSGGYQDYSGQGIGGAVSGDGQEQSPRPADADALEKYISIREDMYKKTKEFDSRTIGFETAIRRPYFHVRPLNIMELENWHNYLDFVEKEGEFNKIFKLYERCLIACANYPEYWIRYVLCMEAYGCTDLANNALERATRVFVKRQPEIHIFAARYKEHNGDIDGARASYQLVHAEISPGLLEAIIKHSNMEYRMGKLEDACLLYEQAITIEKGKEHSQALPMLFAQYTRFLYLVSGNADRAREILIRAVDNIQLSKPLLEALIHLESILPHPKQIDFLDSLVERFLSPSHDTLNPPSNSEREDISSVFMEFVDLFGDVPSIKRADVRHAKLFLPHKSVVEVRKRHAEDYLSSEKAKLVRCYSGGDSGTGGQSVMGVYPTAAVQGQWAGYGVQPQAWAHGSHLTPQAWASSPYSQQQAFAAAAAYSGGGYAQPQVTAQVASASYAAYTAPAYSSQAYPQQQAVAAASVTPQAQQLTSSAYYTGYY